MQFPSWRTFVLTQLYKCMHKLNSYLTHFWFKARWPLYLLQDQLLVIQWKTLPGRMSSTRPQVFSLISRDKLLQTYWLINLYSLIWCFCYLQTLPVCCVKLKTQEQPLSSNTYQYRVALVDPSHHSLHMWLKKLLHQRSVGTVGEHLQFFWWSQHAIDHRSLFAGQIFVKDAQILCWTGYTACLQTIQLPNSLH